MALSKSWTFTLEDGNHIVGMNWSSPDFWGKFNCELTVDGALVNSFQGKMLAGWKYDASFRLGSRVGVVKNTVKVFGISDANLLLDGVLLKAGIHTVIAQPRQIPAPAAVQAPAPSAPPPAQPAPGSQGPVPFYPVLPANCPNCQAPLNMSTAAWTGPMSASCPHCGSSVEIKWKKIGE